MMPPVVPCQQRFDCYGEMVQNQDIAHHHNTLIAL